MVVGPSSQLMVLGPTFLVFPDVRIRFIPSINNARESSIFKKSLQEQNMLNLAIRINFLLKLFNMFVEIIEH